VIGYGSLLFADNQALQSFGKLSISGEIACVLGALLFLPSLLHLIARRREKMLDHAGAQPAE
jgi:predicted RND superfamily exporter protein